MVHVACRTFYLQSESSEDMDLWMQVLNNAVAEALHKQTTVTTRSSDRRVCSAMGRTLLNKADG
jgi:hypothetical protein